VILILSNDPVMAAKPVAQTMASSGIRSVDLDAISGEAFDRVRETSTSFTCGKL